MDSSWQVMQSGSLSATEAMAKDLFLLKQLQFSHSPLLHLYTWENPCLTYGYFTDPVRYLHLEVVESKGLQIAQRPTGGGVMFHLADLAFSVLIPADHPKMSLNTLDNYALINQKVAQALALFTHQKLQPDLLKQNVSCESQECQAFCMAKPTQYDLLIEGKKVGGAAQRRTRQGLLHQGSLSLLFPSSDLIRRILKNPVPILQAMQKNSCSLLPSNATTHELIDARQILQKILKEVLTSI